jgi:hypothetical protein
MGHDEAVGQVADRMGKNFSWVHQDLVDGTAGDDFFVEDASSRVAQEEADDFSFFIANEGVDFTESIFWAIDDLPSFLGRAEPFPEGKGRLELDAFSHADPFDGEEFG